MKVVAATLLNNTVSPSDALMALGWGKQDTASLLRVLEAARQQ